MGFGIGMALRRFLHWGPITATSIIGCITLTTLHMNEMWWPSVTLAAALHKHLFICLSMTSLVNFGYALVLGPGFLPLGWLPEDKAAADGKLQQCWTCEGFKAPRSHHCRKCGRCVKKMDHHCPWINTCVGWRNHAHFTRFLAFAVAGSAQAAVILAAAFYRGINRSWYVYHGHYELATVHFTLASLVACVFSLGLAIGVVIAVGMLLVFQVRAIARNRTGIEDWILEKASYRRFALRTRERQARRNGDGAGDVGGGGGDDVQPEDAACAFRHPYDLGSVWRNVRQVMQCSMAPPPGDGIAWPLAPDCDDPFALTVEQIAQKADKRKRTRRYRVDAARVSGSWVPLWSQGWRVAVNPPCSDEPRLALRRGDVVAVTRWKTHWLFGELISRRSGATTTPEIDVPIAKKERARGWFPRRCVSAHYVDGDEDDDDEQVLVGEGADGRGETTTTTTTTTDKKVN